MQTLVLAATTSKIVGVLTGAVTTTQPDFTVHYADDTGSAFTEGAQTGTFNSTTQADICTAPASSTRRIIRNIVVYNRDTVSTTFTLKYSDNGTLRFLVAKTLAAGANWDFDPIGPTGAAGTPGSTGPAGSGGASTVRMNYLLFGAF